MEGHKDKMHGFKKVKIYCMYAEQACSGLVFRIETSFLFYQSSTI